MQACIIPETSALNEKDKKGETMSGRVIVITSGKGGVGKT